MIAYDIAVINFEILYIKNIQGYLILETVRVGSTLNPTFRFLWTFTTLYYTFTWSYLFEISPVDRSC